MLNLGVFGNKVHFEFFGKIRSISFCISLKVPLCYYKLFGHMRHENVMSVDTRFARYFSTFSGCSDQFWNIIFSCLKCCCSVVIQSNIKYDEKYFYSTWSTFHISIYLASPGNIVNASTFSALITLSWPLLIFLLYLILWECWSCALQIIDPTQNCLRIISTAVFVMRKICRSWKDTSALQHFLNWTFA